MCTCEGEKNLGKSLTRGCRNVGVVQWGPPCPAFCSATLSIPSEAESKSNFLPRMFLLEEKSRKNICPRANCALPLPPYFGIGAIFRRLIRFGLRRNPPEVLDRLRKLNGNLDRLRVAPANVGDPAFLLRLGNFIH